MMLRRHSARRPDPREAHTVPQKPGLVVRRLAFSVPFSVNALLPLYRPALPEAQPLVQALMAEATAASAQLQDRLAPQAI